jgi:hypothetical protein
MTFRLPRNDEHTTIVGKNGSGKTQFGAWLLSMRNLKNERWIIYDSKGDELLNSLENTRELGFHEQPTKPGLYVVHTRPDLQDDWEQSLWRVYHAENTGVYLDEGYMVPDGGTTGNGPTAYRTLLTQGRSKRIPIITLTQRPVDVSRFAFSEAGHIVLFSLNDDRDLKRVSEFTARDFTDWVPPEMGDKLPKYHARWYNKNDDARFIVRPVPDAETIREAIDSQLEPRRRML